MSDWSSDVCSSDLAMRELWKLWTAAMIGLCLATLPLASDAAAQAAPAAAPENSPSDLARDGLESMLSALRLMVEGIPQYELPEGLMNGDINNNATRSGHAARREPDPRRRGHSQSP